MLDAYKQRIGRQNITETHFDWALHPGGKAIIQNTKERMSLTDHQLRASEKIYRSRGNSSSPTVLIVLDELLRMGQGRSHIVAASFGPGLILEMAMMRRVTEDVLASHFRKRDWLCGVKWRAGRRTGLPRKQREVMRSKVISLDKQVYW